MMFGQIRSISIEERAYYGHSSDASMSLGSFGNDRGPY